MNGEFGQKKKNQGLLFKSESIMISYRVQIRYLIVKQKEPQNLSDRGKGSDNVD